jgi:anti-sigma regulatory factor (Ser/Thr protein kinase)
MFVHNINHDLLTPLANIISSARRLQPVQKSHHGSQIIANDLRQIADDGEFALHLLRDMLAVAGGDRDADNPVQREPMATSQWIDDVRGFLRREFLKRPSLTLQCDIDPPGGSFLGDRLKCHRILFNLLKNALEACDLQNEGAITIRVSRNNEQLRVEITDPGKGMTIEDMDKLRSESVLAFPTVTGSLSSRGRMGLKIVRDLVKQHGGELHFSSKAGVGSCFWFTLPQELKRSMRRSPRPFRFAVVGDGNGFHQYVVDSLATYGDSVIATGTIEELLERFRERAPDLVALYSFPQPKSQESLSSSLPLLRRTWHGIPILVLSRDAYELDASQTDPSLLELVLPASTSDVEQILTSLLKTRFASKPVDKESHLSGHSQR